MKIKELKEEIEEYGFLCRQGYPEYAECQKDRIIETHKEAIQAEHARIIKWAEGYIEADKKRYGTDKFNITLEDLKRAIKGC